MPVRIAEGRKSRGYLQKKIPTYTNILVGAEELNIRVQDFHSKEQTPDATNIRGFFYN